MTTVGVCGGRKAIESLDLPPSPFQRERGAEEEEGSLWDEHEEHGELTPRPFILSDPHGGHLTLFSQITSDDASV